MADYENQKQAQANQSSSRIELQTRGVQEMVGRVQSAQGRVLRHARALGYFQDTPPAQGSAKPTPISITMSDALSDLDRALDELAACLNVFD